MKRSCFAADLTATMNICKKSVTVLSRSCGDKKLRSHYTGAHKTVILKMTIIASVRQGWQRNNGYPASAGYPLFFLPLRKAMDLFTAFRYNVLKSILSHPFRDFFKKSQKSLKVLEQFSRSHAIYSRGLNTKAIGGDADGQADRPERFSCGAAR